VKRVAKDGSVSCAAAHKVAKETGVTPMETGVVIDLLEYRIGRCQLGLFGYGPEKKRVQPAKSVPQELAAAIKDALVNDRLPCSACWALAKTYDMTRMQASAACEALGVKIQPCQLGAF
jgi:hypothetical protein